MAGVASDAAVPVPDSIVIANETSSALQLRSELASGLAGELEGDDAIQIAGETVGRIAIRNERAV